MEKKRYELIRYGKDKNSIDKEKIGPDLKGIGKEERGFEWKRC